MTETMQNHISHYGYYEISHGTMRNEDLIPAMLECLKEESIVKHERLVTRHSDIVNLTGDRLVLTADYDGEEAMWLVEDLYDTLNDVAPDGFYFGANEGDGSAIGFWPIPEED